MRLLHYPGRQNIKYYGAQTLGFLLFMTVCLSSRIITNELWAGTGTKPTICCPPVYFPWQTSNDPSVTFCCPKIITTAIEVCIWLFMCPELKLHSLLLSPCICQCDANLYLYPGRHSAVSHGPCDLCHHRSFCVIFVSDLPLSPPQYSASLTLLLIHLVTSLRPRTCKQLTQSRRKTVRLKIICSDDLWIKSTGGRWLCYISTSIPVILEFIQ